MSYEEMGIVRIAESPEGWRLGSVVDPDIWSSPVAWEVLVTEIEAFVAAVRDDVAGIGAGAGLIPGL
ncbi:hypothetical protein [Streptomyces sp. NPDC046759]|uniref:hypothetical protein n=1 Tax=Streptomyces sp. NPDC046759 TaxID=3155019 RepID=UPI0033DDB2E1